MSIYPYFFLLEQSPGRYKSSENSSLAKSFEKSLKNEIILVKFQTFSFQTFTFETILPQILLPISQTYYFP